MSQPVPLENSPAPILGANIYCDRHLDDLLRQVVAPLRLDLQKDEEPTRLWFSRYARRGHHLKLRLHLEEAHWGWAKERILERAQAYFGTLPEPSPEDAERISNLAAPPVDAEDQGDESYPDRSVLWTSFRPSRITVGNDIYLADEIFLSRFYSCMQANGERVLDLVADHPPGELPLKSRQSYMLGTAIVGLCCLDLSGPERLEYLRFHRDWLLRFQLVQRPPETQGDDVLARLDEKLLAMERTVASLVGVIEGQLTTDPAHGEDSDDHGYGPLRAALAAFFDHVRGFRGRPDYDLDPYTTDYSFLPLFKVLHGFAGQVGLPVVNELYTYQLLLRAAQRVDGGRT